MRQTGGTLIDQMIFPTSMSGFHSILHENVEKLSQLVVQAIQQGNNDTAEFTAELLAAECSTLDDTDQGRLDSIYYYGYTLYLNRCYQAAINLIKPVKDLHLGCSSIFARCALKLDLHVNDSIFSLLSLKDEWSINSGLYGVPDVATIYCILGKLYFKLDNVKESCLYHSRALQSNPYLWESYQSLCEMGANVQVGKLYRNQQRLSTKSTSVTKKNFVNKPHSPFKVPSFDIGSKKKSLLGQSSKSIPTSSLLNVSNVMVSTSPSAVRNSNKLLTTPPSKLLTIDKSITPEVLSTPSAATAKMTRKHMDELFYALAKSFKSSCRYDCYKAIRIMNNELPAHILRAMPWCIAQLGKLHFEIVNYEMSEKYFSQLRSLQRTRVKDMEIYSTLLWHLQKRTELSHLCHELMSVDRFTPQTWCCVGNMFSLNKDHDEAIKSFQKATQLDPQFTYAYTLQGHEYSSNDAFDTAKTCYRKALATNSQHYNASYGLGMCCLKLGQYEESLLHFQKAHSINPVNVILICCCGVVLEKLGHQQDALKYYELACELQPTSSLALFKKSQLLLSMGSYNSALVNFEKLVIMAPDEATVHFLLGQLYHIVGRKKDAIKEFTVAMNLDPKGNQLIKDALEKCHQQE